MTRIAIDPITRIEGHLRIEVEIEHPVTLSLRPIAMRRCLINLIQNAARYSTLVRIRAAAKDRQIWLAIDDNGPGIPENQREAVFRPFYRLDASRRPTTGGVGLGLSIVELIVRGHHGTVTVQSAPGAGSTFTMRVPCAAVERGGAATEGSAA